MNCDFPELERWRPVINFEGLYEVSNFARVRSVSRWIAFGSGRKLLEGRILKPAIKSGYKCVCLTVAGVEKWPTIHRIVAEAFVAGSGPVVRHLDGNRLNNLPENLVWGTYQENEADKKSHGTSLLGEKHHRSKLTEKDVYAIREMHRRGITQVSIASSLGIGRGAVGCVIRGETWGHI